MSIHIFFLFQLKKKPQNVDTRQAVLTSSRNVSLAKILGKCPPLSFYKCHFYISIQEILYHIMQVRQLYVIFNYRWLAFGLFSGSSGTVLLVQQVLSDVGLTPLGTKLSKYLSAKERTYSQLIFTEIFWIGMLDKSMI